MTSNASITEAVDTMVRVSDDLAMMDDTRHGSQEHLDLVTSATLLYTLITEMYGPEYFTDDETVFIHDYANQLNETIQEIYS